jgi:5-dehydro-2-deoxygluconokinase
MALAIDHRAQLEEVAQKVGADPARIRDFKVLAVRAAARVAKGRPGYGMLLDEKHGREAMFEFARHPFSWLGRPVELPGSRPLRFEGSQDIGSALPEWPVDHCIKALCFYHPDDEPALKKAQQETLRALFEAARKVGRELLVEIIAGKQRPARPRHDRARAMQELYGLGIKPDWWKLEPQASPAAWAAIEQTIARNDPWCRGVRAARARCAPAEELEAGFAGTAATPDRQGFRRRPHHLHGRREAWLAGAHGDEEAIADMAAASAADRALDRRPRPQGGVGCVRPGATSVIPGRAAGANPEPTTGRAGRKHV